jgi:deoxyribodipyrimidine photolyase-related protein
MRSGQPFLYHAVLSGPLNLHQLRPLEVVQSALQNTTAPLNALEGFTRQIIGWREFVRGIYWQRMPHYAEANALDAELPMPKFYWTGETDMRCLAEAIGHTIDHAYAHHIERLMVLGLFAMLLGVRPYDVHRWHMSMFWDAVDWVSLPNTLGMSQHGDGGIVGTKPYAASGNYIHRMSDHCRQCRFDPKKSIGEDACPFTTLYWNFLDKHRHRFAANGRMKNQYANLARKDAGELRTIRRQAASIAEAVS